MLQVQKTEKKAYTAPKLTTHGEVATVTQHDRDGSSFSFHWRPRKHKDD